jgi:hypothetical protein
LRKLLRRHRALAVTQVFNDLKKSVRAPHATSLSESLLQLAQSRAVETTSKVNTRRMAISRRVLGRTLGAAHVF